MSSVKIGTCGLQAMVDQLTRPSSDCKPRKFGRQVSDLITHRSITRKRLNADLLQEENLKLSSFSHAKPFSSNLANPAPIQRSAAKIAS